jgi:hypothetical protein
MAYFLNRPSSDMHTLVAGRVGSCENRRGGVDRGRQVSGVGGVQLWILLSYLLGVKLHRIGSLSFTITILLLLCLTLRYQVRHPTT